MSQKPFCSFVELAKRLVPQIDAALAARVAFGDGCPHRLGDAMRYSLLAPGKRLRPMLTLLAAEACGGAIAAAMPAACAVEMVHAYSLIHDDLPAMDDDDLRRGRPTCHKAFDEATAILAGDGLLTLAFEVLAQEVQPPDVAAACCLALARAAGACNMVGGQADDVEEEHSDHRPAVSSGAASQRARLESIHDRKTGAMIRASLRLGALCAGADEGRQKALDDYGRQVGLAFQITDDLLDVRSTSAVAGKQVGKDAQRGKLTFPSLLGVEQSVRQAERLVAGASAVLVHFGGRADGLAALAQYVLERDR